MDVLYGVCFDSDCQDVTMAIFKNKYDAIVYAKEHLDDVSCIEVWEYNNNMYETKEYISYIDIVEENHNG